MDGMLQRQLEKDWNASCRVLFGQELGALSDYSKWLCEYMTPISKRKSHVSGREVVLASDRYPQKARFISADEVKQNRDYVLSINDIKDLDTLIPALAEKCEYSGNRYLGNTAFADSSDIITDSQYVYISNRIQECSHVYSCYLIRKGCKYAFGCGWHGECEFTMRVLGSYMMKRCFECSGSTTSSDLYFCHTCHGSHNLMFSFGQQNKNYMIGNRQLEKAKYAEIKAKLLGEIAERLKRDKWFPSHFSLVKNSLPRKMPQITPVEPKDEMKPDVIEKGFASTYKIILKRAPKNRMDEYGPWLEEGGISAAVIESPYGTKIPFAENYNMYEKMPRKRVVSLAELFELGKQEMPASCLEGLDGALEAVKENFYFTSEFIRGNSRNINYTPAAYHAVNTFRGFDSTNADNTAFATLALNAKYTYGGNWTLESSFCIKCYNSNFLTRCFECDFCTKCADCYFCHNCEGLTDCMFCFNMKGARYCIGNTQLSREEYVLARDALLKKMTDELDSTRTLRMSIYNIGAKR
ncbi:MAG: hypothetical protein WC717_05350 [Candidatus Micrarchaeia archaeon]|jgi:hypothetical protein